MDGQDERNGRIETEPEGNHRVFLIRHGETEWNRGFRYQGRSDVPLCDEGERQARRLAVRLSGIAPARVLSSPLSRAYRTAEILMKGSRFGAAIEKCDDLREVSFGLWEGKTVSEVEALDGATLAEWRLSPFAVTPEGGEAMESILSRARRMSDRIRREGRTGEVTFVVAHGAILRPLLGAMLDVGDMSVLWRMRMDNCSVTVMDFWGSHPSLLTLNDTHHLRLEDDAVVAALDFRM